MFDEDKASNATKTDEAVRDAATELGFKDYQIFAFTVDNRLVAATKAADSDTRISPETAANQLKILSSKTTRGKNSGRLCQTRHADFGRS